MQEKRREENIGVGPKPAVVVEPVSITTCIPEHVVITEQRQGMQVFTSKMKGTISPWFLLY